MHRVDCESCKATYQVDDRRIPPTGLKMRCPKCGHTFLVKMEGGAAVVKPIQSAASPEAPKPAAPAAPNAPKSSPPEADDPFGDLPAVTKGPATIAKPTLPATQAERRPGGLGGLGGLGGGRPALPATQQERRPGLALGGLGGGAGAATKPALPATRAERSSPQAKPPQVAPAAPRPGLKSLDDLPAIVSSKVKGPPAPSLSDPGLPTVGGASFDDHDADLPAAASPAKAALPKTVPGRLPPRAGQPMPAPPAIKPIASTTPSLELDFPAPAKAADLPAVGRSSFVTKPDIPKAAAVAPHARKEPPLAPDLELDMSFGEVGLPAIGYNAGLPALAGDLPELAAALPEVASALPQVAASLPANVDSLPVPAYSLPANVDSLPVPAYSLPANVDSLPVPAHSLPANVDSLPMPAQSLPARLDSFPATAESLPTRSSAPPAEIITQDDLGDFGELDLPPGPLSGPPGARTSNRPRARSTPPKSAGDDMGVGRAADFGDLFGGSAAEASPAAPMSDPFSDAIASVSASVPPPKKEGKKSAGGGAFGEIDFGDEPAGGAEIISTVPQEAPLASASPAAPRATSASLGPTSAVAPTEVAIGAGGPSKARDRATDTDKGGKGKLIVAGVLVLALAGAALEATPYGAFGRYPISDMIHAGDYQKMAVAIGATTRSALLTDTYPDMKKAVDAVEAAHHASPRARPLAAYAAIAEYEKELRFGVDPDAAAKARLALGEIPPNVEVKYANVATALQDALGDIPKGRAALDAASKRDPGDPIQEDVAFARGALELRARDGKAAVAAFDKALSMRPSDTAKNARAHYGLARAHAIDGDVASAAKEIELTIAASPKHAGARLLKARLAWDQHDEATALAALAAIIEGDFRESASPSEQASAFALRGDIQEAKGRSAEARAAYESAIKLEAHNVDALLGQGESLFSEGRFTEALSRFDTAVQADPLSVRAILADARGKIALERLADAKTQLTQARVDFPKNPRVAVELGKANEALGDKPAAEQQYLSAIDLVDVTRTEAIEPYVALAGLLAAEGRTKDAEAKLEEARVRLPDSAQMQRALGEVAAAQGSYDVAVTHYQSAIEKNPSDISTKFLLGVTYRRMGKMDLAAAQFDDVAAGDKDYPGLAMERGLLYEASGDVDKALEQFQSARAKAPDDPDLALRVGAAYVAIGRPADAVPVLQKVLEKRPESAEANHYLGRALFMQGGPQETDAMRYLKRAVELDPNRAEYHLYVAWAANNAAPAQLSLAKDEIDKALGLDKLLADGYWQRGVLELKEGSIDDAIKDLKRALELKPTRFEAHATLALCFDNKNDTASEMAEWQRAIAGNDRVPEWRLRYGKLLLDRGQSAEATKHLVFAALEGEKLQPRPGWLAEAEFNAGEALRKTGQREQAIERYKKFLEIAPTTSPDRKDAQAALAGLGAQ